MVSSYKICIDGYPMMELNGIRWWMQENRLVDWLKDTVRKYGIKKHTLIDVRLYFMGCREDSICFVYNWETDHFDSYKEDKA